MEKFATILITSKNRASELIEAVTSALAQSVPCEIIVIDDGSTDATPSEIPSRFPSVRYIRHDSSEGYIKRRNEGIGLARCEIVFSIDDDAIFQSPHTVEQTLAEFDDPRIGAVAIPFVDVKISPKVRQKSPSKKSIHCTSSFIGTAHALKRSVFEQVGGYRFYLRHQGEEGDLCIRLLHQGYIVRLGNADPIHHFESPKRDHQKIDLYGRRNDILFCWYNVPIWMLPVSLAATVVNGLRHGIRCGRVLIMFRGILLGFASIAKVLRKRDPVSLACFSLFRRLKKSESVPLDDIVGGLPKPQCEKAFE
jgi:GT2 family glycosyltransferase